MRPILFRWRGFVVHSYPALLYCGLVAGIWAGHAAAQAQGIDAFRTYVATLVLIVFALIGSRLLYVASNWPFYRQNIRRILDPNEGGASMYGGFALALLLSVPLLATLSLPLGAFWDVSMITILVGMIFTRIGCLLNGCCGGRPSTNWGVYLPNHLGVWEKRVPTQFFEGGWAALLLIFAIASRTWLPFPGALCLLVTAGYAFGRLLIESMREPEPGARTFNMYHAVSVVMVVVCLAALAARWPR
jgi:prolipoprotein diacylglyceryltransferase